MKTLTIKNNIITNVSEGETTSIPPQGVEYQTVTNDYIVDMGWVRQNETFINPDPPTIAPPVPLPEWKEFNTTLLTDPDWLATAAIILEGLKIGLYANASAGDAKALQSTLAISLNYLNETQQPIDPLVLQRWQKLAEKHHIPITFT